MAGRRGAYLTVPPWGPLSKKGVQGEKEKKAKHVRPYAQGGLCHMRRKSCEGMSAGPEGN